MVPATVMSISLVTAMLVSVVTPHTSLALSVVAPLIAAMVLIRVRIHITTVSFVAIAIITLI